MGRESSAHQALVIPQLFLRPESATGIAWWLCQRVVAGQTHRIDVRVAEAEGRNAHQERDVAGAAKGRTCIHQLSDGVRGCHIAAEVIVQDAIRKHLEPEALGVLTKICLRLRDLRQASVVCVQPKFCCARALPPRSNRLRHRCHRCHLAMPRWSQTTQPGSASVDISSPFSQAASPWRLADRVRHAQAPASTATSRVGKLKTS